MCLRHGPGTHLTQKTDNSMLQDRSLLSPCAPAPGGLQNTRE